MKLRLRDRFFAYVELVRFALAYLGFDPSHQPMFDMMLDCSDLANPDDWHVTVGRSIKMGYKRHRGELLERARQAGGVAALRVLYNKQRHRSVTLSIYPYASAADAQLSLKTLLGSTVRRPFSKFVLLDARIVERTVPGIAEVLAYEEQSIGSKGPHWSRLVAGTVEHIAFSVRCGALSEAWPWDEVVSIAAAQVSKITRSLSEQRITDVDQ